MKGATTMRAFEPACDHETNENEHPMHCRCERCFPEGSDPCEVCHVKPAAFVRFTEANGARGVLRASSCGGCQREAFAGL